MSAQVLTQTRASFLVLLTVVLGAPRPVGAAVPSGTDDLTPDGLANLVAFARAFGPIRFFHPSDQAASAPWEEVAIAGADRLESARSGAELTAGLSSLFSPYAPTAEFLSGGASAASRGVPQGAKQVVRWRHHGFAFGTDPTLENIYFARREAGPPGRQEPSATFELGRGVRLVLPLAVWVDATGATLPLASASSRAVPSASPPRTARASRLATVVLAWTAVRHFHPHLRDDGIDWDRELVTALHGAATATGRRELLVVLKEMMAALHDGHARASLFEGPANLDGLPPVTLATVGDQLVVATASGAVGAALPPGSVLVAVDGEPVRYRVAWVARAVSAGTRGLLASCVEERLLAGPPGTPVSVTAQRPDGGLTAVTMIRAAAGAAPHRGEPVRQLPGGVVYVDLSGVQQVTLETLWPRLAAGARAVVFDLRRYPNTDPSFLQHLIDVPISTTRMEVPIVTDPANRVETWDLHGWDLEPLRPRLRGRVAFLAGGGTISYGETLLEMIDTYRLGLVVGDTSAGTNGNIVHLALPDGFQIGWTGMRVRRRDGSPLYGRGIAPHIRVVPTVAGLAAGRDEVLDRAIRELTR